MSTRKQDVLITLCIALTEAGAAEHHKDPTDCFCAERTNPGFQFSQKILDRAVSAIRKEFGIPAKTG